jgi:SWI/SNF-related matrix-associated actin-dependent regulator of chromatin subfamily B member 1
MTSPVVTADSASRNDQHQNPSAQVTESIEQHSTSNGVPGPPRLEGPGNVVDQNAPQDGNDAIQKGKEWAKAVIMEASGFRAADQSVKATPERPTQMGDNAANGVSQSRKRSRSGSRRPVSTTWTNPEEQHPATEDHGRYLLTTYIQRDQLHAAQMNDQAEAVRKLFEERNKALKGYDELAQLRKHNPAQVFGYGYAGFGNGRTDDKSPHLIYPISRKRPGNRRARKIVVKREDMANQSDQLEELVPIRLDIEHDKIKLRDTFTWNLHDRVTPPEIFSEILVEDFQIPPEHMGFVVQQVNQKLQEQIQDHYPHVFIEEEPLDPHLPYFAYKNDEMRILIKLNITIGPHTLVDQFEWEINNPMNNPEEFAKQMTRDLSLSGEFTTAIAHQIREQSQVFTKSLYITGHPFDGRPIDDADVREAFLPSPVPSVFRPVQSQKEYMPYLYELSESDLQREELSILREQRRQKRSVTRRGGPTLPDLKDRERTVRTLVVSSVLPGAAENLEESRLFKLSRSSGRGRRPGAGRTDGGDDSDESEEEESDVEEVIQPMGGTARTRGIRNAATAAQVAMRANLGRSATPEIATLHHHETRTSARRIPVGYEVREESVPEPTSLIVKLRISNEKFKRFEQNRILQKQTRVSTPQMHSATPPHLRSATSMPPPPSPAQQPRSTPQPGTSRSTPAAESQTGGSPAPSTPRSSGQQWQYYADGRVDAPYPKPASDVSFEPLQLQH